MMSYLMSFSSYAALFSERMQRSILGVLDATAGVFPLELQVSESRSQVIKSPAEYHRAAVPEIYRIDGDCLRVPLFSSSAALEVFFVESNEPASFPTQFQLVAASLEKARLWPIPTLLDLVELILRVFPASDFFLCDQQQLSEKVYSERTCSLDLSRAPLGVFWVNYFSRELLVNLGGGAEEVIKRMAVISRSLPSGLLFATQEHPYRIGVHEDEARLKEMEFALGYDVIQQRFPLVL